MTKATFPTLREHIYPLIKLVAIAYTAGYVLGERFHKSRRST